jgi:hypothetical protein
MIAENDKIKFWIENGIMFSIFKKEIDIDKKKLNLIKLI